MAPETPLLDPDPIESRPVEPVTATQVTDANSEAVYATDTSSLGSYLDLIAGVRLDRFAATYHQVTVAAAPSSTSPTSTASPARASRWCSSPSPGKASMSRYGTSFDPSAEALTLTTKTANLGPVKATTYEAGSKTSVLFAAACC